MCHASIGISQCEDGVPKGIRTPVAAVKGQCPRPLDDGDVDRYFAEEARTLRTAFQAVKTSSRYRPGVPALGRHSSLSEAHLSRPPASSEMYRPIDE